MTNHSSNKKRDNDLITLTHQIQAPLVGALSRISLILEDEEVSANVKQHLEFSNLLLINILDLVYGVLVSSGIESGQKTFLSQDKVTLSKETMSIFERVVKTSNRPDLKYNYFEVKDFPLIQIDKRLLQVVLYILIQNAVKYADKESNISFRCFTKQSGESIIPAIELTSFGPPILASEKEKIFEKYYRGVNVSSTGRYSGGGIGLGLWVAKTLMQEAGGNLTIKLSTENERLATFAIFFYQEDTGNDGS